MSNCWESVNVFYVEIRETENFFLDRHDPPRDERLTGNDGPCRIFLYSDRVYLHVTVKPKNTSNQKKKKKNFRI